MTAKTKAALLMLLSALSFSMLQIVIAATADTIPLFEQLFFRNLVATFLALTAIQRKKLPVFGKKGNRTLLLGRSTFGYLGMITLFYASGTGNQGDVSTIIKMSPFVVTILAFFFLKERITKHQIIGLIVATTGVVFISNPEFNSDWFPLFIAGLSCLFSGVAYTLVSALKGREAPETIIFVFSALSTVATIPLMLGNLVAPSLTDWGLLILIGIFAAIGQITLTNSYTLAKASEVSIYNYAGIVFSMILGFCFLSQTPPITSLIGSSLVIAAGLIVFISSNRNN